MKQFRVECYFNKIKDFKKSFIIRSNNEIQALNKFTIKYPHVSIISISEISNIVSQNCISKLKQRSYYKTRLCQIRNSLRTMIDEELGLLTQEEKLQLQRVGCKLERVITLFSERTMNLRKEGKL